MSGQPQTARLRSLIADMQVDVTGALSGLTSGEYTRAWAARHHDPLSRRARDHLVAEGLIKQLRTRRTCVATGKWARPWVLAEAAPDWYPQGRVSCTFT